MLELLSLELISLELILLELLSLKLLSLDLILLQLPLLSEVKLDVDELSLLFEARVLLLVILLDKLELLKSQSVLYIFLFHQLMISSNDNIVISVTVITLIF